MNEQQYERGLTRGQWVFPLHQEVSACASALDRLMPGWEAGIKVSQLDMSSAYSCVLGQLARTEQGRKMTKEYYGGYGLPGDYFTMRETLGRDSKVIRYASSAFCSFAAKSYWAREVQDRLIGKTAEQRVTKLIAKAKPEPKPVVEEVKTKPEVDFDAMLKSILDAELVNA